MRGAAGELPDEPGVDGAEGQLAGLGPGAGAGDVVEQPGDLGAGEVGVDDQAGLLADERPRGRRASGDRRTPAVRRSCQTIALWIGLPVSRSQTTVVSRWLVMPMAAMSRGRSCARPSASVRRRAGWPRSPPGRARPIRAGEDLRGTPAGRQRRCGRRGRTGWRGSWSCPGRGRGCRTPRDSATERAASSPYGRSSSLLACRNSCAHITGSSSLAGPCRCAHVSGQPQAPRLPAWCDPPASSTATRLHEGWAVRVRGERIEAAGPADEYRAPTAPTVIDLPGTTLLPGTDRRALARPSASVQRDAAGTTRSCKESTALARRARRQPPARRRCWPASRRCATSAPKGAGYADVELKQAIEQGIIPGPRMLVDDARDRRDRQLRAEGLRARLARAAGRRRGRRRRRWRASCATRSATAPTGSRSTPTTAGARAARRRRPSRSRS